MSLALKENLAEKFVGWKTRKIRKAQTAGLEFPVSCHQVKNVLVILPHQVDRLDAASEFVRILRKNYPSWKVEIFDADKLSDSETDRLNLPRESITGHISSGQFNLVIDLHSQFDLTSAYLSLLSRAQYRVHIQEEESDYYNIRIHLRASGGFTGISACLQKLFTSGNSEENLPNI